MKRIMLYQNYLTLRKCFILRFCQIYISFYFTRWSKSHNHDKNLNIPYKLDRVKRIWYLSPMRAAKVQASLRIRAVSPEPSLLAHRRSESRGTFRQKARSLVPLNGWACAVKMCHDGMLEDTNSLDGAQLSLKFHSQTSKVTLVQQLYCLIYPLAFVAG